MKTVKEIHALISSGIENLKLDDHPGNLYDPIRYILSLGGKRIRPILVLLAYQLRKDDVDKVLLPALAVELFHNFTLMHDDIMDGAPLRRGKPTVHEKWDQTVAILSGDTMLVKVYDLLLKVDQQLLPDVISRFNKTATEVCEGQQIDMDFETLSRVDESKYIEMIRLKTAVLLGFSLEMGGIMAGFDENTNRLLFEMGQNIGIGFQLMDDYLDVYGNQSKFGKQVGGDIIANKKTYLLINAMELAREDHLEILHKYLQMKEFDPDEKVASIKKIYDELGIDSLTKTKMNHYFDRSYEIFDKIESEESAKQVLRSYIDQIIRREK